jgi:hypothetical protein
MADGTLKVGTITTSSGSGTITIPNTVTVAGAMANTPAFEATLSADQSLSNTVASKILYNTELFDTNNAYDNSDTNNAYDNSVNYRFTPQIAGKYYVYHTISVYGGSQNSLETGRSLIYKNGSSYSDTETSAFPDSILHTLTILNVAIIELNGTTDYVEAFGYYGGANATGTAFQTPYSKFGAYRLIGV